MLSYSLLATGDRQTFEGPDGPVSVDVELCTRTNSGDTCPAGALQHQGLILQPSSLVGDDLRSGALAELMPGYLSVELGIYAVYPSRQHVTHKVRLLIDDLVEAIKAKDRERAVT